MRASKILVITLFLLNSFAVCGQSELTREQYILKYKDLALLERDAYGIPASITMAQALLESENGNSRLARQANNHFGIKCKKEWTGRTISHTDDAPGECFRKYGSVEESFRDHSEFLFNSARYASLFKLKPTDFQGWAYGLKSAGYATNPKYAQRLITIIEENKLYLLDDLAAPETEIKPTEADDHAHARKPIPWIELKDNGERIDVDNFMVAMRIHGGYTLYKNNGSEFVIAKKGDTFETLSGHVGVSPSRLRKFNDLPKTAQPTGGDMVYVKHKSRHAVNGKMIHIVMPGETLHGMSQLFGIRLKSLISLNRTSIKGGLHVGQQIRLM